MPYYTFRHKKTGKEKKEFMTIAEAEEWVKKNPAWEWMCGAPGIGDPMSLGRVKPRSDFQDRLREIKKKHKGSTIDVW